jgi:type II restriction/modification system DNA methylase subunit YeeA
LKPLRNIQHIDAIIDLSGSAREPQWPTCDVIVGNPPFLGGGKLRSELGDAYVEALFKLYGDRIPNFSDLCCYWFEKAREMLAEGKVKRVGLLATQGIRGGSNREVLKRIKETGDIFWAQSDRNWLQDGVAVHVSMVGFDSGTEKVRVLDNKSVTTINADLTASIDLTQAKALKENQSVCFRSDEKGGPFDIDGATARSMLAMPNNPNGRPNSDVVRQYYNARDVLQKWQDTWIIDFGCDISQQQAALYEMPFEYVKKVVKPVRDESRSEREREYWWLHRRPAPDMRMAVENLSRYIATPSVSKHRLFVWLDARTIPDHQLYIIARDDDYFFGVLHSRVHELWARGTGTQLREAESGFRYTPTTTFETFPFPWPPGQEPGSRGEAFAHESQLTSILDAASKPIKIDSLANASPLLRQHAIAQAAKELNELRQNWLNPYPDQPSGIDVTLNKRTLTNLYNEHPTWLQLAHRKLDDAVLDAYGWPSDLSDDDILARLLALNLGRAAA